MKRFNKQQYRPIVFTFGLIRTPIGLTRVFLHFFSFIIGACPVLGQQYLFEQESTSDHLWSYDNSLDSLWSKDIYINKLSKDGNWVAITEDFPVKENALLLLHTKTGKKIELQGTYNFEFAANSK